MLDYIEREGWVSGLNHQTVNLAPVGLRRFESYPLHQLSVWKPRAHIAQPVEHVLGKNGVGGSSPPVGSIT